MPSQFSGDAEFAGAPMLIVCLELSLQIRSLFTPFRYQLLLKSEHRQLGVRGESLGDMNYFWDPLTLFLTITKSQDASWNGGVHLYFQYLRILSFRPPWATK